MKKIIVFLIITFIGFNINAQSIRQDSSISFRDTLFETPFIKHIYEYNNEGKIIKRITWRTSGSAGMEEYKLSQMDTFSYNEQGLLSNFTGFVLNNGVFIESVRTISEYDENWNNTSNLSQKKDDMGNDWIDTWLWTNTFENGLLVESKLSLKFSLSEIWIRVNRDEYFYAPNTSLVAKHYGFIYDFQTSEEQPNSEDYYYYDADGFHEKTENYRYDENTSSFYLSQIRNNVKDDFGNEIMSITSRIDSNGTETLSSRSTLVYNTNIERSQVYLPTTSSTYPYGQNKHITLHSTYEIWEDEEWKFSSNNVNYYSGLTGTDDQWNVQELNVFPNPATSIINLGNLELLNKGIRADIINSEGVSVYNRELNDSQIDIEHLSTGLYHILLRNGTLVFKSSFIKL